MFMTVKCQYCQHNLYILQNPYHNTRIHLQRNKKTHPKMSNDAFVLNLKFLPQAQILNFQAPACKTVDLSGGVA